MSFFLSVLTVFASFEALAAAAAMAARPVLWTAVLLLSN